jgi:hypothetical protein
MNRRRKEKGETETNVKRELVNQETRAGAFEELLLLSPSCGCCALIYVNTDKLVKALT